MKKYTLFTSVLFATMIFILSTHPVLAADNTPVLKEGIIDITVENDVQSVKEEITISNTSGFENRLIEHILLNIGDIKDLSITSDTHELPFEVTEDGNLSRITVQIPEEYNEEFYYVISYSYTYTSSESRIPLILPPVSTDGNNNDILLKINVPEGQYIQDSFPIIDGGNTGIIEEYMMNMPSFVKLDLSETSFNLFTTTNMYTLFGLIVIIGVIFVWVAQLLKSNKSRGGSVNV